MRAGAVVAAAGLSRRMRREKILLPLGGATILERVLDSLAAVGVREVAVVLRRDLAAARAIAERSGARVVENAHPEDELLSSIRLGTAALDSALDAFLVWPADHPLVQTETLERLLESSRPTLAVIPAWHGRRGHPALVGAALRKQVEAGPLPGGLRQLWREHPEAVVELPVEDEGVVLDLNTPEDYDAALRLVAGQRTEERGTED